MGRTTLHKEAVEVLRAAGKPLHLDEIWQGIAQRGIYQSRSPTPEKSLATQLLRKTPGVQVSAATDQKLFSHDGPNVFGLLEWQTQDSAQLPPLPLPGGAGFGDPKDNKLVEEAAIKFVSDWYKSRSWDVDSVEREKCGYDLVCRKHDDEDHVEVKGVSGSEQSFIITAGEVKKAQTDTLFRLCVVTGVVSDSPTVHSYSGKEFLSRFSLEPMQFHAQLQPSE